MKSNIKLFFILFSMLFFVGAVNIKKGIGTIANDSITEAMLDCVNSAIDGYSLEWSAPDNKFKWILVTGGAGSGITSLNGLTGASQTFATPGTTGTAPAWSSATTIHSLNIPMASAANVTAGLISKTEYDTFNNKLGSYAESDPIVKAINGIVKSNTTTISAATAGTDYQSPFTVISPILKSVLQAVQMYRSTGSIDGYLHHDDFTIFNNKQPAMGSDDNYVTDAEKIIIGNTSGTNTGDASGHSGLQPSGSYLTASSTHKETKTFVLFGMTALETTFGSLYMHDGTNFNIYSRAFDDTATEYNGGVLFVPSNIAPGTVTFYAYVSPATGAANKNVALTFSHFPVNTAEAWDAALTLEESGDAAITATTGQITLITWTETIANLGWSANDIVFFRISRKPAGSNNLVGDMYWPVFVIEYNVYDA